MRKYIELAKKNIDTRSDAELGRRLGVSRNAVCKWKNGESIGEESIVKLARICGVNPVQLLAEYELTKEHTPQIKKMWESMRNYAAGIAIVSTTPFIFVWEKVEKYILCKIESDFICD